MTVDLRDRFFPRKDGQARKGVGFARMVIVVSGAFSVAVALYLSATDQAETWNLFLSITGLFGVPLAGVFALGIFTKRANTVGVIGGLILGAATAFWVQQNTTFTPFAVSAAAFVGAVVFGYIISAIAGALLGKNPHDVVPLTIYGKKSEYVRRTSSPVAPAGTPLVTTESNDTVK
ncbi:sodium:solute symporter family transporter [Kocuria atrinae]|uniref:sodium:solute symporter family transporter n=1 Tax=Kocuria atrinae TaxID=592377 RepID=UPI0002DB3A2C|nr:hypothetical protein [Kocuria atrinae]